MTVWFSDLPSRRSLSSAAAISSGMLRTVMFFTVHLPLDGWMHASIWSLMQSCHEVNNGEVPPSPCSFRQRLFDRSVTVPSPSVTLPWSFRAFPWEFRGNSEFRDASPHPEQQLDRELVEPFVGPRPPGDGGVI